MAIHYEYDSENPIYSQELINGKFTETWNERSGEAVEDYITRRLKEAHENEIVGGKYENETLTLTKASGKNPVEISVTVAPATYDFDMVFYGLRVDGVICTDAELLMQYKDNPQTKVEAGIAIRSVAQILNKVNNNDSTFQVTFEFNGYKLTSPIRNIDKDYFVYVGQNLNLNIPEGQDVSDVVAWADVSELFKKRVSGQQIKASFTPAKIGDTEFSKVEKTLSTKITNEVIKLKYGGDVITKQKSVQVQFENNTSIENYNLIVFNNNQPVRTLIGNFEVDGLEPGLNQLIVRAEHSKNKNICTDWFSFDIICTENFEGTAIAVNGVSSGISNNGVATLYRLYIYSSLREEIELTTYLEDNIPSSTNPVPQQVIKSEFVQASSYNRDTNATEELSYKKYIEVESEGSSKYLLIKTTSQGVSTFYKFKTAQYSNLTGNYTSNASPYIKMEIEKCIPEYTYIKRYGISKNYDQITGQINNLFSTQLQSSNYTLIPDLESSDGWRENDGITYLKLSKQGKSVLTEDINLSLNDSFTIEMGFKTYNVSDKSQSILNIGDLTLFPTQIGWNYGDGITSEKFLKRNSQFQEGVDTHVVITVTKDWTTTKDDPYYPDYLGESAQSVFDQNVSSTKLNLMRIYINGCIDREIVLDSTELAAIKNSRLHIEPKSADIDLYLFRVYNSNPLSHQEIIQNYISFLPNKTGVLSKESVYNKNDILDDNGRISWEKCQGKLNTLLFIYHKDGVFPNRFWGQDDNKSDNDKNKKVPCTLIINYADPIKNVTYGGVLDKLQCKGQGSSAMRYLIWNVNSSLNKFKYTPAGETKEKKAKSKFKPFGNIFIQEELNNMIPEGAPASYKTVEGYYPMPNYDGEVDKTDYKYTKMVGKVNFASSMQSHKVGACKLFDDAYKDSLGTASLPSGGKKAVHEEPFMYFYIETDTEFDKGDKWKSSLDTDSITYDKILELGREAKFMGFQTWGPGKGDDACSGFDEDVTPQYLMLEGGENTDPSVNFQRPWQALQRLRTDFPYDGTKFVYDNKTTDLMAQPTVTKEQSLANPAAQLLIDDESIVFMNRGAWDIDYGFEEIEVGEGDNKTVYYEIPEGKSRESLKVFREFFDNVYKWDFTCEFSDSSIREPQSDWNQNKKYCVLANAGNFKINNVVVQGHQAGDVYRFDEPSNTWVRAGVYYDNGQWERLNFSEEILAASGERVDVGNEPLIKDSLKALFKIKVAQFIKLDDIAFHQAFIKFLSGTDNRAKNTYFQIIGPIYHEVDKIGEDGQPVTNEKGEVETEWVPSGQGDTLIRLIGDDLDTILVTDNNGLQSKPYNLIEDSYDESFYSYWGDVGNLFLRMFDKCYETEIRKQLSKIIEKSGLKPSNINNDSSYFYKQFFKVQEDFPAIAYNTTATIYYENAQLIKDIAGGEAVYGFTYTNNDIQPIEQSHGSCLEGEKQFMKERVAFLAGYAGNVAGLDNELTTSSSAGGGKALKMKLDFIPNQDFYPTYQYEKGVVKSIGTYADSEYDMLKYKAEAGKYYEQVINEDQSAINQNLFQVDLYKTLSITGLQTEDINANLASTTELIIDNDIIKNNQNLFGSDYPVLNLAKFSSKLPVVEKLVLKNLTLPSELNLEDFYKLRELDLSGSSLHNVVFPQTGLFETAILPGSIKTFEIYDNKGLQSITFDDCSSLETVYIDGSKCGNFDIAHFCEQIKNSPLKSVILRNLNGVNITEDVLLKLISTAQVQLTGTINVVDEEGTLKVISFATKKALVELFGDIHTGSNGLVVNYKVEALNIRYPVEVSAFYNSAIGGTQDLGNPIHVTIAGNDINIVQYVDNQGKIKYRLAILYTLIEGDSKLIKIDSYSGNLTLSGLPSSDAKVKITYNGIFSNADKPTVIKFKWSAPRLGDFFYEDGSFSSFYQSNKKLLGLVYAKDGNENTGTVYIIGTERSNTQQFPSYVADEVAINITTNNLDKADDFYSDVYLTYFGLSGDTIPQVNTSGLKVISPIYYDGTNTIQNLVSYGLTDTKAYVDFVNTYILPKLSNEFGKYITKTATSSGLAYSIDSLENLNGLCEALQNKVFSNEIPSSFNASLVFPYFYSAWLYKPSQHEETKDLKWYIPSIHDLTKVIYQYGISHSAKAASFTSNNAVTNVFSGLPTLSENLTDNDTFQQTPVFALAYSRMGKDMCKVWLNLFGGQSVSDDTEKLLTTSANSENCYGYVLQNAWVNNQYTMVPVWEAGLYSNNKGSAPANYDVYFQLWSYTKRYGGIPFTQVTYSNPQQ